MENNIRYQVATGTYRIIASGFYTYDSAFGWADGMIMGNSKRMEDG